MIVSSTPFRYLVTPSMQKSVQNKIKSLNWEEMEKSPCVPEISDSEFCVRIPGGGITKTLYDEGCSKEIPVVVLLKFVSEGDSIPDALGLVEYLNEWLQIIKSRCDDPTASALPWKISSSWRLLFGSGLPSSLFLICFQFYTLCPKKHITNSTVKTTPRRQPKAPPAAPHCGEPTHAKLSTPGLSLCFPSRLPAVRGSSLHVPPFPLHTPFPFRCPARRLPKRSSSEQLPPVPPGTGLEASARPLAQASSHRPSAVQQQVCKW
ncbi:PREDICTED: LOW QUALITY PROTEIN: proteasome assembly chaperone 2 [Ceratotherium simum simum]|uniref:LOW QUALITY PROTEIN: proteasome assembly chaperone 2 n=1 Tax=Ceratotherium simum simum TaxID=73337 RepID=A0ABM1C779_CERSS|nr:PREDICTED: LOW QUALITY PROTEIN: proteasome assembly chaperone 2 [Ceratotherium simum simum]